MKRRFFLLVLLIFTVSLTGSAFSNGFSEPAALPTDINPLQQDELKRVIEEVFGSHEPGQYQALRGGLLPKQDKAISGFFLIMTRNDNQTMALVLDIRHAEDPKDQLLIVGNLEKLTTHLFKEYIGCLQDFKVDIIDYKKLELSSGTHGIAHLNVTFADEFTEPDIIMRLQYPEQRTVILMLGLPAEGTFQQQDFSQAYLKLEAEAQEIISKTTLSHRLLPSERYILWKLKEWSW